MELRWKLIAILVFAIVFQKSLVFANVPNLISYSGVLFNKNDNKPVKTGQYNMVFEIYDQSSGGNLLWHEEYIAGVPSQHGVQIQNGVFNVVLGSTGTTLPAFDNPCYLAVKFAIPPAVPNEEFNRQQLLSVPYAFTANHVAPNGITTASIVDGAVTQEKAPWAASVSNTLGAVSKSKIIYGTGTTNSGGIYTYTFPVNYFLSTPVITTTIHLTSALGVKITLYRVNGTSFEARSIREASNGTYSYVGPYTFDWIALGK
jgi:hypothetical protein